MLAETHFQQPAIHLIQGILRADSVTILEMTIPPGASTPAHVHHQFNETFAVLAGDLQVNIGSAKHTLRASNSATVPPGLVHFFLNQSDQPCQVRITVSPGNKGFEEAMFISYGLAADGLANQGGTPHRLLDLALFLHIGDVNVIGLMRVIQPVITWLARQPFAQRRLTQLRDRYVPS